MDPSHRKTGGGGDPHSTRTPPKTRVQPIGGAGALSPRQESGRGNPDAPRPGRPGAASTD